jgi:hypothetical protein
MDIHLKMQLSKRSDAVINNCQLSSSIPRTPAILLRAISMMTAAVVKLTS